YWTPAEPIGRVTGRQRPDHGSDESAGNGKSEQVVIQREDLAQRFGRTGDYSRVKAEKERAQGGDDGAKEEQSGASRTSFGGCGLAQGVRLHIPCFSCTPEPAFMSRPVLTGRVRKGQATIKDGPRLWRSPAAAPDCGWASPQPRCAKKRGGSFRTA